MAVLTLPEPAAGRGATALTAVLVACSLGLGGCASTGDCLAPGGASGLTPAAVMAGADTAGRLVRWGGTLVSVAHLRERTELTVLSYPLDDCGRPRTGAEPQGRFLLRVPGFVETANRAPGSSLSARGILTGREAASAGGSPYLHPVVESQGLRWWSSGPAASPPGGGRPWISIGIGGGSGGVGGGVGVTF